MYCVAPLEGGASPDVIGIDSQKVYSVSHDGLCALVHDCPPRSYASDDGAVAAEWVATHHHVVEAGWKRSGSVLPMTFNTIISSTGERRPRQPSVGAGALCKLREALVGEVIADVGTRVDELLQLLAATEEKTALR